VGGRRGRLGNCRARGAWQARRAARSTRTLDGTQMLAIEFEPPGQSTCECCGGITTRLTRFITIDGDARGVYYAVFSDNHPDPHVIVLLSLGEWWNGTNPDSRSAFAFRIWLKGTQFQVGVLDAETAGWPDASIMGKRMTRAEALAHPMLKEAFHISDHITAEDPEIRAYFKRVERGDNSAV
jgi:hypothetical protein